MVCFGSSPPSLQALLIGPADDANRVCHGSGSAGQVLIRLHGHTHLHQLLPLLEEGIRHSSALLLGKLLSLMWDTYATATTLSSSLSSSSSRSFAAAVIAAAGAAVGVVVDDNVIGAARLEQVLEKVLAVCE